MQPAQARSRRSRPNSGSRSRQPSVAAFAGTRVFANDLLKVWPAHWTFVTVRKSHAHEQARLSARSSAGHPSLSTSGETLTIEESMNLEGENGERRNVGDGHEWSYG